MSPPERLHLLEETIVGRAHHEQLAALAPQIAAERALAVAECGDDRPLFPSGARGRCAANGTATSPRITPHANRLIAPSRQPWSSASSIQRMHCPDAVYAAILC